MKRLCYYAAVVAGFATMLMAMRCTNMTASNTSEVGNPKLSGHLVDGRSSSAAQGAMVRVYPVYLNKMAQALGKTATGVPAIDSTLTDHAGYYSFDSLKKNVYSIEAKYIEGSDTLYMRHPSVMFIESQDLGYDTLRLPGWIRGKVVVPGGESAKNITCYIPGTSYMAITNDTGGFRITGIPAGAYSLSITGAKLRDTTLYDIKVTPGHETNAGYIVVGFDRGKNEHDVWGVFDSSYNCKAIDSIIAVVSGDSIPADMPRIYKLDWRPSLSGYSGFIYVPDNGFFWKVDICVFDTLGRRTGAYRVPTINRATGDVEVPSFNPFNSVPLITLHDTTVSINDTIRLHAAVSTLADDSIESMEWKIGNAGTFTKTTNKDTFIIAPKDFGSIPCIFKVTDKFGNIAIDSAHIQVFKDVPVVNIGNDTTVSVGSTLTFTPNITQAFGFIAMYIWSCQGDTAWTDSGNQYSKSITFRHLGEQHLIYTVRDDDGNLAADTVNILVVTEIGGVVPLPMNVVLRQSGSPYVVKGNLIVPYGGNLRIEPGVIVRINPGDSVIVKGSLDAEGTIEKGILFTRNSLDTTTSNDPWTLEQYSDRSTCHVTNSSLRYCQIISSGVSFAAIKDSFYAASIQCYSNSITLDSCQFSNTAIAISGPVAMRYCNFNKRSYVSIFGTDAIVVGNMFTDNSAIGSASPLSVLGDGLTVSSNRVTDGREMVVEGSGVMDGNLVQNSTANGIRVNGHSIGTSVGEWTITNNICKDNAENGIFLSDEFTGDPELWTHHIQNNTIVNNRGSGILVSFYLYDHYRCIIRNNTLSSNGRGSAPSVPPYYNAGIACANPVSTIDSNTITDNNIGVVSSSGNTLTNNNIYNNTDYDFRVLVNDTGNVTAPNNWWGTTDTAQIQKKIFDYNDDNGLGKVIIDPVAPAEIPGVGPR
jgi:parallel beta-helix repeat protein